MSRKQSKGSKPKTTRKPRRKSGPAPDIEVSEEFTLPEDELTEVDEAVHVEKGDLAYWANMSFVSERPRLSAQIRLAHLAKVGRTSTETKKFLQLALTAEKYCDDQLALHILSHPTWPWASRVKGAGKEVYPKVVGLIEKFGRYYEVGDPMIPDYVKRGPQAYKAMVSGEVVDRIGIWVAGIERLTTPSKLWKFSGFAPEDGHSMRREKGKKLRFSAKLRMALYRLGVSFNRAGGVWYGEYERCRRELETKLATAGIKIVPTPRVRTCLECQLEVLAKKAEYCPKCGLKLSLKLEPPGFIFKGHVHQRTLREMLKNWEVCLWLVWRQALGLPVTQPYSVVKLEHPPIDPWKMVDREA